MRSFILKWGFFDKSQGQGRNIPDWDRTSSLGQTKSSSTGVSGRLRTDTLDGFLRNGSTYLFIESKRL